MSVTSASLAELKSSIPAKVVASSSNPKMNKSLDELIQQKGKKKQQKDKVIKNGKQNIKKHNQKKDSQYNKKSAAKTSSSSKNRDNNSIHQRTNTRKLDKTKAAANVKSNKGPEDIKVLVKNDFKPKKITKTYKTKNRQESLTPDNLYISASHSYVPPQQQQQQQYAPQPQYQAQPVYGDSPMQYPAYSTRPVYIPQQQQQQQQYNAQPVPRGYVQKQQQQQRRQKSDKIIMPGQSRRH
jgi:hypothetical protein